MEGLVVHQGQAVLGEAVVGVERMPGGEGHPLPRVPAPGETGVVVVAGHPPASLPPPHLGQPGEEGGEQLVMDRKRVKGWRQLVAYSLQLAAFFFFFLERK